MNKVDTMVFIPRFTCVAKMLVPIETSSKVAADPLAVLVVAMHPLIVLL
jgi:hypothetical protein